MADRSQLAWLLRGSIALQLLLAGAIFCWLWPGSAAQAVAAATLVMLFVPLLFVAETLILAFVARSDTSPRPTPGELASSWAAEVRELYPVFYWRLPFRWQAEPDRLDGGRNLTGVVLIHGFVCNRGFWTPWMRRLRNEGRAFSAVNLEPVFTSIDDYVPIVEAAVERITQSTGRPPVLVCHSMGGLAARAWLRAAGAAASARVARVITIGTPHRGTWLGRFSHLPNGRQMQLGSAWLRQLQADESGKTLPPFSCWYSNCDNIVFPTSTATLPGADNKLVRAAAHVDLAFRPEVIRGVLDTVAGCDPALL